MTRHHCGYVLTLALMFIAPSVSIGDLLGLPGRTTLSLGILGLLLWALLKPACLIRLPVNRRSLWPLYILVFAVYITVVSVFSGSATATIYAAQYLGYAWLALQLLSNYLYEANQKGDLDRVVRLTYLVGLVYALGLVASAVFGPIYPEQQLYLGKVVDGELVMRASGFDGNPNNAAGITACFGALALLPSLTRTRRLTRLCSSAVYILALTLTVSRSAVASAVVAGLVLFAAVLVRQWLARGGLTRRSLQHVATLTTAGFFLGGVATLFYLLLGDGWLNNALSLVSFRATVADLETGRFVIWRQGLELFLDGSTSEIVFGQGFRNSMAVSAYGTWQSAHNLWLSMLADFGVVGTLVFALTFVGLLLTAVRQTLLGNAYGHYVLFVTAFLSVHNLTEVFLYATNYLFLFIFAAVLISTVRVSPQPLRQPVSSRFPLTRTLT